MKEQERNYPTLKYYKYFESEKTDKCDLSSFFKNMQLNEQQDLGELGRKKDLFLLVLGSAAPKNLESLSSWLEKVHPPSDKEAKDKVLLIDISERPLRKHQDKLQTIKNRNSQFFFTRMDMNEVGIVDNTVDIVISDFTINFNSTLEDIERLFAEIARVLKSNGAAFMSMMCSLEEGAKSPSIFGRLGTKQYIFPLSVYKSKAEQAGFDFHIVKYVNHPKLGLQVFAKLTKKQ